MKKLLAGSFLAMAITGFVASAQATTVTYGWEDAPAEVVLGTYSSVSGWLEDGSNYVHTGQYSLGLDDGGGAGSPQAYVGWITGLQAGDEVTASFWVYDVTGGNPSGRIWGHYTNDVTSIDSYAGSAGGSSTYSGPDGWKMLVYTWTFDDGDTDDRTGLVIEARTYTNAGDIIYLDDLTITAPDHATIITAGGTTSPVPVPGSALLLGTALTGLGALRRRSA